MAIYKLSDVVGFIRGNSTFQKKDLKSNGKFLALHYGKTYKVNNIDQNYSYYVDDEFFKENQVISKGDSILITTSETVNELGKIVYYSSIKNGLLGGEQIKIYPIDEKILHKKYLFYWFKKNYKKMQRFATGIKVFRIKGNDFKYISCNLPSINEQQKIIDIIEPLEKLKEKIKNMFDSYLNIIKNLDYSTTMKFGIIANNVSYKPKNLLQLSAKIMKKKNPKIKNFEPSGTYKTNTFYTSINTLLINTIRPYLEKFAIVPSDCDSTGTLMQLKVKKEYETTVLSNLLNQNFWSHLKVCSKGTKMPVVSKKDILNFPMNIVKANFKNVFNFATLVNKLEIKIDKLYNYLVELLTK